MGVAIMGGCCGTDPDFIKAISIHKGKTIYYDYDAGVYNNYNTSNF